jgi:hypothetical protein
MKKIIVKDDGLNGSPNSPSGYKYLGYNGGTFSENQELLLVILVVVLI